MTSAAILSVLGDGYCVSISPVRLVGRFCAFFCGAKYAVHPQIFAHLQGNLASQNAENKKSTNISPDIPLLFKIGLTGRR